MADKHSLNYDVRELKLGASFTNNKSSQYHTIKYDFKPASVDVNKMATVDVGTNNQVTVTVPHLDGAGVPQTVFKGSQRPYAKECVLIIDRVTGEITLEKLSSNIQVKKTRQESAAKPRPLTPVACEMTNTTQRSTSRTRVATNRRTHNTAAPAAPSSSQQPRYGSQKTPPNMVRSPQRVKTSPPQAAPWSGGGNSTLASLPMIGLDDLSAPAPAPAPPQNGLAARAHPSSPRSPALIERHEPRAEQRPEPRHEPRPEQRPEPRHELRAEPRPEPRHEPRAEHRPPEPRSEPRAAAPRPHHPPHPAIHVHPPQEDSSSSSSSDSDSDSGSDSDDNAPAPPANATSPRPTTSEGEEGITQRLRATSPRPTTSEGEEGITQRLRGPSNPALPRDVLNDDLCLSESGSDSDSPQHSPFTR